MNLNMIELDLERPDKDQSSMNIIECGSVKQSCKEERVKLPSQSLNGSWCPKVAQLLIRFWGNIFFSH